MGKKIGENFDSRQEAYNEAEKLAQIRSILKKDDISALDILHEQAIKENTFREEQAKEKIVDKLSQIVERTDNKQTEELLNDIPPEVLKDKEFFNDVIPAIPKKEREFKEGLARDYNDGIWPGYHSKEYREAKVAYNELISESNLKIQFLEFVSPELQNDREFMTEMMDKNSKAFQFVSPELKADKELAEMALQKDGQNINYVDKKLLEDKDFILQNIKEITHFGRSLHPKELKIILSDKILNDEDFAWQMLEETNQCDLLGDKLLNNKNFVLKAMKELKLGQIWKLLSDNNIKKDSEIILLATEHTQKVFGYNGVFQGVVNEFPEVLLQDKKLFKELIKKDSFPYDLSEELFNDADIVEFAIENGGGYPRDIVRVLPDKYKKDKNLMKKAILREDYCFELISDELKIDKEFIFDLIKEQPLVLRHLSDKFKKDLDFIIEAIKVNPDVIENVDKEILEKIGV